ncbi:amidohydrolase family protein [Mucilaginibacter myungsuensis]|uniref:Amidohydrolase family protein n=1 Tax=Mucilaginibacter myungsuensis TaxID=649104 RepID=A0A929PXP3_9SPHI|nr:amidohydrolase family protein [Mucilaginibacter myungsuensis]MBE9664068.1 amidohydrolase family protein [Mucilaginibacter myungsuensis]MDN3601246.1 amidohydrolase family protein [Mucilaginibacter myungsuensis]
MKKLLLFCFALLLTHLTHAQDTYPVNGPWDVRPGQYAFTNATIVVSADQTITNGTLLVKDRTIEAVGAGVAIPKGYITVDLKGKFIYPALVDAFTAYGTPDAARAAFGAGGAGAGIPGVRTSVMTSSKPGAYGWNEAIKPEMNVKAVFHADAAKAQDLKRYGFGAVQSIIRDGIARGTSAAVTLGEDRDNFVMLNDAVAAHYSFSKGTAATNYPSSLMGSVALLRQSYYDAAWYKTQKGGEYNISLDEFNKTQALPQIFEVSDPASVLRAAKLGKEFGKTYIYKTEGKEYQKIDAIKALGATFIIPVSFPAPFDIEDPLDARSISFEQLKDWELAPTNPAALEKAGVKFALTSFGVSSSRDFYANIRKAMEFGLTEKTALNALTTIPAEMLGISDKVGTLAKGKLANFVISSAGLFKADAVIYENWVQGRQFVVARMDVSDIKGKFTLTGNGFANTTLTVTGNPGSYTATIDRTGADSVHATSTFIRGGDIVSLNFDLQKNPKGTIRLSGYISSTSPLTFKGSSIMPDGTTGTWTAVYTGPAPAGGPGGGGFGGRGGQGGLAGGGNRGGQGGAPGAGGAAPTGGAAPAGAPAADAPKVAPTVGPVIYPFVAYGNAVVPKAETTLFKNATVWTNEKEGVLKNADVLIEGNKIKAVGKNLTAPAGAKTIDATNKHITAGIIDEHSHIAGTGGINEGSQSVTAEVRIGDVIDPEDVNIYRQLAGGVTTSQILHGSANAIGGQSQLMKHRWGVLPEELKFENADGFIKFALGENVKGSNNGGFNTNPRFPQTRMGVEETMIDAFTRAKEYKAARAVKGSTTRRDLELDALVEILDGKRFITCHSYVQSEINMLMHVADSMGFKINTFTHILEGYKVADKMKAHGISASTFSDWWAYKNEVAEAIPYNGKVMHEVGLNTGFNSDDEEMARRLNQEAAKAITYGKMSEEDALKLVTLNPAKMLHIDGRVGSLKAGKDADIAVWSANPLSIYAVCEKTYVDGIAYWDLSKDAEVQKAMKTESGRIIQKMIEAKRGGSAVQGAAAGNAGRRPRYECETLEEENFTVANDAYVQDAKERAALHKAQKTSKQ